MQYPLQHLVKRDATYVPSWRTDITVTFERERLRLATEATHRAARNAAFRAHMARKQAAEQARSDFHAGVGDTA